ncbi:hypothetical protein LJ737_20860 [Hymenobacter sp. 15J16-1T3B]|uniref:hypothetical protein n=1 Tax=Hymenobacter sp. 15J16-1T3B TaxID=2886941 RepID=UPI001D1294B2|nr:hypothetical protein [Hymenobacter sp. 15J16-1T3B]MCC3159705.1 hypothetical protein [Hymenobacter sp. 15J16-1T3B]
MKDLQTLEVQAERSAELLSPLLAKLQARVDAPELVDHLSMSPAERARYAEDAQLLNGLKHYFQHADEYVLELKASQQRAEEFVHKEYERIYQLKLDRDWWKGESTRLQAMFELLSNVLLRIYEQFPSLKTTVKP